MFKKSYRGLCVFPTFEERLEYLRCHSKIGLDTFGFDRYLNQAFYHSPEWRRIRDEVIVRDAGYDLGCLDRPIVGKIYIHHINPITPEELVKEPEKVLSPEFLVCCSFETHNAIHYGSESPTPTGLVERRPNDTCPWKH